LQALERAQELELAQEGVGLLEERGPEIYLRELGFVTLRVALGQNLPQQDLGLDVSLDKLQRI
jgi:hypothetical protein